MKRCPQAPVRSHQAPAAPHSPSHPAWLPPRQGSKIKAEERGNVRWRTIPGDTRELCVTQPELGPVPTQPGEPRRERKAGSAGLLPPVLQKEQKLKSILQFLNFLPCPLPFRKVHTYVFANRNIYIYIFCLVGCLFQNRGWTIKYDIRTVSWFICVGIKSGNFSCHKAIMD